MVSSDRQLEIIESPYPKVKVIAKEQQLYDVQSEDGEIDVDIASFALLVGGELAEDRRNADESVQNVVYEKRNYHVQLFRKDESSIDRVD